MDSKSKWKILHLLFFSLLTVGCDSGPGVLSMSNDYQALELPVQNVYVAVNDLPSDLKRKNPAISDYLPDDSDQSLMFSGGLNKSNIAYDDGDVKFSLCANSFIIYGNDIYGDKLSETSNRTSTIEIGGCKEFSNDYNSAIKYTEDLIKNFEKLNPHAIRLDNWFNSATSGDLKRFYGITSAGNQTAYSPISSIEAAKRFSQLSEKINKIQLPDDTEFTSYVVLAVFEGKDITFTIGLYTQKEYGGDNLDFAKEHAIRYAVSAAFKRKYYEGSVLNNPIKWNLPINQQ